MRRARRPLLGMLAFMLETLTFLLLQFLRLLVFLRLDPISLLHLSEAQWVGQQRIVSSLLLLFNGEQRVFSDLGRDVAGSVCVLHGDEVLVGGSELGSS